MQILRGIPFVIILFASVACRQPNTNKTAPAEFGRFLENYFEKRLQLFPLEATMIGDSRYNDTLLIDISDAVREQQKSFFRQTLDSLHAFTYNDLADSDRLSYDILDHDVAIALEGLSFHDNYMPVNQFDCLPLVMGQLGSGQSAQPFVTVKDYDDWLKRLNIFSRWLDTSIVYFRKGIASGIVLPKTLVVKVIPQLKSMTVSGRDTNLYYLPIKNLPETFSVAEKQRIESQYDSVIQTRLVPSYQRLLNFLESEYLPVARHSTGISEISNGPAYYNYCIRANTTTQLSADSIYKTGLSEVKRIRQEMEQVKISTGFKGDLKSFLSYLKTDKKFFPYKNPEEVLNAFRKIYGTIRPNLHSFFIDSPKTGFEIRQTEAFRAASASAEYSQGSPDATRPGLFYIPIVDATRFNTTSGMESLFLHEAIPGHHYQVSLQQENKALPKFRRFGGNNAYLEGWALYCESLGLELGLYKDPYQYMGALSDEIHRAVRLVVDVGMHAKKMTREEAIQYMLDNQTINESGAVSEIERYMALPAQALSYKIGSIEIQHLRAACKQIKGNDFSIAAFHHEILKEGPMPLELLEKRVLTWAKGSSQ